MPPACQDMGYLAVKRMVESAVRIVRQFRLRGYWKPVPELPWVASGVSHPRGLRVEGALAGPRQLGGGRWRRALPSLMVPFDLVGNRATESHLPSEVRWRWRPQYCSVQQVAGDFKREFMCCVK